VRGAVLDKMSAVEATRWVGPGEVTYTEFRTACRSLETACLVARVPRAVVLNYLAFAHAARLNSGANWERHGDDEVGGFVSTDINDAVVEAAEVLTKIVWSPWLKALATPWVNRSRNKAVKELDSEDRAHVDTAQKFYKRKTS